MQLRCTVRAPLNARPRTVFNSASDQDTSREAVGSRQ